MKKYLLITVAVFAFSACEKNFNTINSNPNGFTTASDGSLFNAAIRSLSYGWNEQLYINVSVLNKEVQLTALPQVRWNNYTLGTEEVWSNYYNTLPNFRELEKRFKTYDTTKAEVLNMMAMAKTLLAIKTFKVTDMFGDVPFSEAGYGFQSTTSLRPNFDQQSVIYKMLLADLAWASTNFNETGIATEPFLSFKKFDNLYQGDIKKWRKLANSMRLRYAMRMVNKEPTMAGAIIKDIIENNKPCFGVNDFGQLIMDHQECAAMYPFQLGFRNESKGWSYNQAKDPRLGTTFWQLIATHDSADGSGIFDPRAFYFFETNNNNKWVPFPNAPTTAIPTDGGIPYEYQRDVAFSIKGAACLYSPLNYYLVRDMDFQPDIFITGAEVLFIRAEAYLRGIGVNKDAGMATTAFLDGIQFSLNFWQQIMQRSKLPLGAAFNTNITVPSHLSFISVQNNLKFFSGTEQQQLQEIYAQQWIDFIRQPQEAWALARRTQQTPRQGTTPLQVNRFTIPPTEATYNQTNWLNAIGNGGDNLTTKVWWMN